MESLKPACIHFPTAAQIPGSLCHNYHVIENTNDIVSTMAFRFQWFSHLKCSTRHQLHQLLYVSIKKNALHWPTIRLVFAGHAPDFNGVWKEIGVLRLFVRVLHWSSHIVSNQPKIFNYIFSKAINCQENIQPIRSHEFTMVWQWLALLCTERYR